MREQVDTAMEALRFNEAAGFTRRKLTINATGGGTTVTALQ